MSGPQPPATLTLSAPLEACACCTTRVHDGMHIRRGLGCACQDLLVFYLQVVDVVAKSLGGAVIAPESGQKPGDPAAGRVSQSGRLPRDLPASGTSAVGRVHEAGQEVGNPAASSRILLGPAPEVSLASSSTGGEAQTSNEHACRAASSNAAAVAAF